MKSFVRFIGRLPFYGKVPIRSLIFCVYHSTTRMERCSSYLRLSMFLILLIFLHAIQAIMGIEVMGFECPVWVKGISGLYATINVSVVIAQIYLCFRATNFLFCGSYSKTKKKCPEWPNAELLTMLAVTLIGQIVFITLYFYYAN